MSAKVGEIRTGYEMEWGVTTHLFYPSILYSQNASPFANVMSFSLGRRGGMEG